MDLFRMDRSARTCWASFENPDGAKGRGGTENRGAKGHPCDGLRAGESVTLMAADGAGTIHRIWMTLNDRSPAMLRGLRLEMFWDGAARPAVAAPLGDFFGVGLGRRTPFENALFSDPEGRSFNCIIPMPFRRAAEIRLTNDGPADLPHLFYDVNYTLTDGHSEDVLYFHSWWSRERPTRLGVDFEVLPTVCGRGRYLGANIGVVTDPAYGTSWWGEGECKVYLDGDRDYPSLVGTGTEDYIGTGWGQGVFSGRYQGCLVADGAHRQWAFYRYHVPDPLFFQEECRVALQQIGGAPKVQVLELQAQGAEMIPISIDSGGAGHFVKLLEAMPEVPLSDPRVPEGWCNFYRRDDVSACAYFYLDRPANELPALAPVEERTVGLAEAADA